MGDTTGTATAQYSLINASDAFNGNQYQQMTFVAGSGRVALLNYGLDCQLGLSLQANQDYEGYAYVRAASGTELVVSLEDSESNATLASVVLTVNAGNQWQRLNFTLVPSANSTCSATNMQLGGMEQYVYGCSGRLAIALTTAGSSIDIDLVYLSPGSWGTLPSQSAGTLGLPARLDVATALQDQSMQSIRIGGSMTLVDGYRWKMFRGPRELRQPYQGYWYEVCRSKASSSL